MRVQNVILLLKAWDLAIVQGEAAGIDVKARQPVPESSEVDLHFLVESLAR
jgi:hypothetical protein